MTTSGHLALFRLVRLRAVPPFPSSDSVPRAERGNERGSVGHVENGAGGGERSMEYIAWSIFLYICAQLSSSFHCSFDYTLSSTWRLNDRPKPKVLNTI